MRSIVVLYHASCPDGFGAAYAAWKKFGDSAEYIPVFHDEPVPNGLDGRVVYIVDFSYPEKELLDLEKRAARLVVLDHHIGAKAYVEKVHEHVFDNERSGAGIAWGYFHPEIPLPRVLAYIQDSDLWRHTLPHWKEVGAFLSKISLYDLDAFDELAERFQDDDEFARIIEKGSAYADYIDYLCNLFVKEAEEVEFGGYRILAVNAPRLFRSAIGNILAKKQGPFAIVWYFSHGEWHLSLRGDGSIDLSEFAKKFGGNGHRNASGIRWQFNEPLPFTFVPRTDAQF